MSWYYNKPKLSSDERRAKGQKALSKRAKQGVVIEPLPPLVSRLKIATSFWGRSWCQHLESFSDYENRLPRGRTYLRNGSVLHLAITEGEVSAIVMGSELYEQNIRIKPLAPEKWQRIQAKCRGKIGSLIELLQGKISDEIMAIVTDPQDGLFPHPKEITINCSCPDHATLCKHAAAVLYGVGARLDSEPELLFRLRGVDHSTLIAAADVAAMASSQASTRRRLDAADLGDVFGVELDEEIAAGAAAATAPVGQVGQVRQVGLVASPAISPAPEKTPPPFRPTAAMVRRLRVRRGVSTAEFAADLGVEEAVLQRWEARQGRLSMEPAVLQRLSAIAEELASESE